MFFTKILSYLKNERIQRLILFGISFILIVILLRDCSDHANEIARLEQNLKASRDVTKKVRTKNKQIEYQKVTYVSYIEELKLLNSELAKEIEKEVGDVKVIIKEEIVFKTDTLYIDNTESARLDDTTYRLDWDYNYKQSSFEQQLSGYNVFNIDSLRNIYGAKTAITKNMISLNVIAGLKEIDDTYHVFVRTQDDNPYISFKVDGNIDPDLLFKLEDRWIFGPHLGVSINGPINSFTIHNTINWSIGLGVTYKMFGF